MKVVHWLLTVAVAWWFRQHGTAAVCKRHCGPVAVPYPFGLETNCARSTDFLLNCTNNEGSGVQLMSGNLNILRISVRGSVMVIGVPIAYKCYDDNGRAANKSDQVVIDLSPHPQYKFSETLNILTVLGCNIIAVVADDEGRFGSGCVSYCRNNGDFANGTSCSGRGCCQALIPKGLKTFNVSISSLNQDVSALQFGRCALAFGMDESSSDLSNFTLPSFEYVGKTSTLALDWMIESGVKCDVAARDKSSYACGPFAECKDFRKELGYQCVCNDGYEGNPYDRKGCTDINECENPERYPCHGKCKNTLGSYTCHCPFGKQGDGKVRCHEISGPIIPVAASIIVAFFLITIGALVLGTWRRRSKEKNFRRNGGELLKHQRVKIFTEVDLAKATNHYHDGNKLGEGGFGCVYRGIIARDTVIAVKKPKDVHKSLVKGDFQHELEIVMQINHKNVVKLHGICLETRIPLLVYEYISNGTLFQHIHQNASTILRSWKNRLRIATETALALEYMHSCAEPPIIHGDIKSVNILLDQSYSVKVSDFGTSVLISPERSHVVANEIQGTLGYIDPEYLTTGILTVKSDVYSFGVVLVELLTEKKPTSFITKSEESIGIIIYFISSVKDKTLSDVISFKTASEDEMDRIGMVAEIAVKCLDQSGARRPTMREVVEQLAKI